MSRSKRKTPIAGFTNAASEKEDKRKANRTLRRLVKASDLISGTPLPVLREVSNVWKMAKDGKTYVDPARFPEIHRK